MFDFKMPLPQTVAPNLCCLHTSVRLYQPPPEQNKTLLASAEEDKDDYQRELQNYEGQGASMKNI